MPKRRRHKELPAFSMYAVPELEQLDKENLMKVAKKCGKNVTDLDFLNSFCVQHIGWELFSYHQASLNVLINRTAIGFMENLDKLIKDHQGAYFLGDPSSVETLKLAIRNFILQTLGPTGAYAKEVYSDTVKVSLESLVLKAEKFDPQHAMKMRRELKDLFLITLANVQKVFKENRKGSSTNDFADFLEKHILHHSEVSYFLRTGKSRVIDRDSLLKSITRFKSKMGKKGQ